MTRRELFTYFVGLFSFCVFGRPSTKKRIFGPKNIGIKLSSVPLLVSMGTYYMPKKAYEHYSKEFFDSLNK